MALLCAVAQRAAKPERLTSASSSGPGPNNLPWSDSRVAALFAAVEREGLSAALDSLERAAAKDSVVLRGAHQLAHSLGRKAMARAGQDAGVISQCRPIFASGCYHGVVEEFLHARGGIDTPELERMCIDAGSPERPGAVHECVHGLGHGILGAARFDATRALEECNRLSQPHFAASCHEGVFMEAIGTAIAGEAQGASHVHHDQPHGGTHGRLDLERGNPYSPCDRVPDPYADSCWLFQGFVVLRYSGFDAAEAFGTCDDAPEGRAARCYESIGHQLTGLFQRSDGWMMGQCAKGLPALAPHCAAGATMALNGMDWSGGRASRFCGAAPNSWKALCYRVSARSLVALASLAQRRLLCETVEPEYASVCRQAAAIDPGA